VERDAEGRRLVIVDASFLINFLAVDRMDIVGKLPGLRFHLVNHVRAEVRHDDQRARLGVALAGGMMTEIEVTDPGEVRLYGQFRRFLGDGESASLAVAVGRRWVIAADEKGRFRREVFARLGDSYLLNTLGALLIAIRAGVITVAEAEALRTQLRAHRFEMDPIPFDELLREE
jgi:predicted nucleic acid-binding protein